MPDGPSVDCRDRVRICGRASQGPSAGGRLAISTISCIPAFLPRTTRLAAALKPPASRRPVPTVLCSGVYQTSDKGPCVLHVLQYSNCKPSPAPPSQLIHLAGAGRKSEVAASGLARQRSVRPRLASLRTRLLAYGIQPYQPPSTHSTSARSICLGRENYILMEYPQ
jgi:hypothetical protein